jgi:hypothetical protein
MTPCNFSANVQAAYSSDLMALRERSSNSLNMVDRNSKLSEDFQMDNRQLTKHFSMACVDQLGNQRCRTVFCGI